jgi:hypothetical protein
MVQVEKIMYIYKNLWLFGSDNDTDNENVKLISVMYIAVPTLLSKY